jgi:hypothetical protein
MDVNPFRPPQTDQPSARKSRGLGKFIDQLDDAQKDWLLLAFELFVAAPLFYFLFYW